MKLIEEMERCLPIPVYASKELRQLLRKQGKDIDINTELKITKVFVVSLTHLRVKPDHPLSDKVLAYQKQRIKSISRSRRD